MNDPSTEAPARRNPTEPPSSREWLALGAIVLAGAGIRLFQLGTESIWLDEALTRRWISRPTWGGTLSIMARGDHPPLYFAALRAWAAAFSNSLVSMRAFSALFSILTIPLFHRLARLLLGKRAALFAAILLAFSPYHLYYAQEARSYTFLVFWEVALFWAIVSIHRALLDGRPVSWLARAAAVLSAWAAVYTHYTAQFVLLAATGLWAVLFWERPRSGRVWREGLAWLALAYAAALPCLWIVSQRAGSGQGAAWLKPLSIQTLYGFLWGFSHGVIIPPHSLFIALYCAVPVFGLAGLSAGSLYAEARRGRLHRGHRTAIPAWGPLLTLLAALLIPPVIISIKRPVVFYGQRYEITATIPWILLLAAGLGRLWGGTHPPQSPRRRAEGWHEQGWRGEGKWAASIVLGAILAGNGLYFLEYFNTRQKREFDTLAASLRDVMKPGDAIATVPEDSAESLLYYMPRGTIILAPTPAIIANWAKQRSSATLYWVSIQEKADPAEVWAQGCFQEGPTVVLRVRDIPGALLRVTAYRLPPRSAP